MVIIITEQSSTELLAIKVVIESQIEALENYRLKLMKALVKAKRRELEATRKELAEQRKGVLRPTIVDYDWPRGKTISVYPVDSPDLIDKSTAQGVE